MGDLTEAMSLNTTNISDLDLGGDIATLPPKWLIDLYPTSALVFIVVISVVIVGGCVGNTMIIGAMAAEKVCSDIIKWRKNSQYCKIMYELMFANLHYFKLYF